MDRNGILRLLLLFFLIFSDVSNASFLLKIRQLVALQDGNKSVQIQASPSPSPDPAKTLNTTNTEDNSTSINNNNNSSNISNNNNTGIVGPSSIPGNQTDSEIEKHNDEPKKVSEEKDHHKTDSESEVGGENCTTVAARRCTDLKSMTACVLGFDNGSQWWTVLIQNSGEHNLSVDVLAPNPIDNSLVEVGKHRTKKVHLLASFLSRVSLFALQINLTVGENAEVILNAKNGECVLHLGPLGSHGNFFLYLPSYDQLITPINGAYFLIITVVVFGGTLACCMCRKRRREAGIAYQELEMAMPESGIANDVETAAGWDKDWDDNWDEENAIKSPAVRHSASVSANGLTSRNPNKDGWENDWDD
ncbi:unnamed protein product [Dovyalis caffra]|uniref:DUF7356 domain-containing protein n=1 Tax=Dovyalis caffra TaxID=77055 RepID=A0AAV1S3D2_9ROSI|nr:unnamed protein product [Dovyalis caffra]